MPGIEVTVYNKGAGKKKGEKSKPAILFILGWANHDPDIYLKDLLESEKRYEFHVICLPDRISKSFMREYVKPVQEYLGSMPKRPVAVFAHSLGGLVARHIKTRNDTRFVFFSPWWGNYGMKLRFWDSLSVGMFSFLNWNMIDIEYGADDLGDLERTKGLFARIPKRVSFKWLFDCSRAQHSMPPPNRQSVVFYSLSDVVISKNNIGSEHVKYPYLGLIRYDGYHEFFNSRKRKDIFRQAMHFVKKA